MRGDVKKEEKMKMRKAKEEPFLHSFTKEIRLTSYTNIEQEEKVVRIDVPCKNSMKRSKSEIWVFNWTTSCSFIFRGLTNYKIEGLVGFKSERWKDRKLVKFGWMKRDIFYLIYTLKVRWRLFSIHFCKAGSESSSQ